MEVWVIVIGIVSVIANIGIAIYNIGKNRTIYEVERILVYSNNVERDENALVRPKLSTGEYTVLHVQQLAPGKDILIYILGKIKR